MSSTLDERLRKAGEVARGTPVGEPPSIHTARRRQTRRHLAGGLAGALMASAVGWAIEARVTDDSQRVGVSESSPGAVEIGSTGWALARLPYGWSNDGGSGGSIHLVGSSGASADVSVELGAQSAGQVVVRFPLGTVVQEAAGVVTRTEDGHLITVHGDGVTIEDQLRLVFAAVPDERLVAADVSNSPVTVPSLVGLTDAAATNVLGEAGLHARFAFASGAQAASGTVVAQDPAAGTGQDPRLAVVLAVAAPDRVPPSLRPPASGLTGLAGIDESGAAGYLSNRLLHGTSGADTNAANQPQPVLGLRGELLGWMTPGAGFTPLPAYADVAPRPQPTTAPTQPAPNTSQWPTKTTGGLVIPVPPTWTTDDPCPGSDRSVFIGALPPACSPPTGSADFVWARPLTDLPANEDLTCDPGSINDIPGCNSITGSVEHRYAFGSDVVLVFGRGTSDTDRAVVSAVYDAIRYADPTRPEAVGSSKFDFPQALDAALDAVPGGRDPGATSGGGFGGINGSELDYVQVAGQPPKRYEVVLRFTWVPSTKTGHYVVAAVNDYTGPWPVPPIDPEH